MIRSRARCVSLLTLALGLLVASRVARAQDDRKGFLGGIQEALSFRSPSEAFAAARQMSSAEEALPVMKRLAEQGGDGAVAARASLWLGHYDYGAGWTGDALAAYRDAWRDEADDATRSEARFWVLHCENLLESAESTSLDIHSAHRASDILAALAAGDRALRGGDPRRALQLYLEQEGAAERLGCLGPVYYRLALLHTAEGSGAGQALDPATLQSWETKVARSPERALVAAFEKGPTSAGSTTAGETAQLPDSGTAPGPQSSTPPPVLIEAAPAKAEEWVVQLGAYRDRELARNAMEQLTQRDLSVRLERTADGEGGEWFRIRLGREANRDAARDLAERLCQGLAYDLVQVAP